MGEQVEVFVVGDSWAALAGNPLMDHERELPYGLGRVPAAFGKLKGELGELRDPALPDRGRFNVVAYHPWGIPASTTAGWASGNPCSTPGTADPCKDILAGLRSQITARLMDEISSVAAPGIPLVYLSLGGNDVINAGATPANGGVSLDLNNTSARNTVLAGITNNLNQLIGMMVAANPRVRIIIPGYVSLPVTGPICDTVWPARFPAMTGGVSQAALDLGIVTGLTSVYQGAATQRPTEVWFEGSWFFRTGSRVSASELDTLCLHLTEYEDFIESVLTKYVN